MIATATVVIGIATVVIATIVIATVVIATVIATVVIATIVIATNYWMQTEGTLNRGHNGTAAIQYK